MNERKTIAAIWIPFVGGLVALSQFMLLAGPVGGLVHFRSETGHYYVWIATQMKWNAADSFARKYSTKVDGIVLDQWHLATITDSSENAFVHEVVLNSEKSKTGGEASFLGAIVRDGGLRNFKWVTGEPFIYSNFAPGQPDVDRENVIEMGGTWGPQWNNQDGPNSPIEATRAFILEREPDRLQTSVTVTTIPDVSIENVHPRSSER